MNRILQALLFSLLFSSLSSLLRAESKEVLLEDLGTELLEPAIGRNASLAEATREEETEPNNAVQSEQLQQVVVRMREAHLRLENLNRLRKASHAQQQAISSLDEMITVLAEKKSQCMARQCSQSSLAKEWKNSSSSSKAGFASSADAQVQAANAADATIALQSVGDLVKDLWGHLPQRQRDQILQPLSSEYLPQYAAEIEAYFRDLASPK